MIDFFIILLVLLLICGCILIANSFTSNKCPPTKIEYRYVPRTFQEESLNPVKVTDIFNNMFTETSIFP